VEASIVHSVPTDGRKLLALTFDDGPSEYTDAIVDLLGEHGGHGTFFVLGEALERDEQRAARLRRASAAGHEIGNHTYSHPHLGELADDAVLAELARAATMIAEHTGSEPRLVRCPYGEDEARVARLGGFDAVVGWSVDPEDWSDPDPAEIVSRVLAGAAPGGIVVLHDGDGRANTVTALRTLVPALVADGFELVTVSDLLKRWERD
jgi:peptidoglycan/xylan/chitin deacetylase (PgdA/CDA1 family)